MKPVFKCDYCSNMGTEEEIREHELQCFDNYDRKSCYTCEHKKTICSHNVKEDKVLWVYECQLGKEIPRGSIIEFCETHKRKEKSEPLKDLVGDLFGFNNFK